MKKLSLISLLSLLMMGILSASEDLKKLHLMAAQYPAEKDVLFNGKTTEKWVWHHTKKPTDWPIIQDALEVKPLKGHRGAGDGSIITKNHYNDIYLHLEFKPNHKPRELKDSLRGNSGVVFQESYEVQILDSYKIPLEGKNDCAAIYGIKNADKNAARPTTEWQTYDIFFTAAHWNGGKKVKNARLTVFWNGVLVHDDVEVPVHTAHMKKERPQGGPILLQEHQNAVQFRNIWVKVHPDSPPLQKEKPIVKNVGKEGKIDLVKLGYETFHGLGCAECHSEIKDDLSVKTGPGLYGLFQPTERSRNIKTAGEGHVRNVKADLPYFLQSIRKPNEELAIAEHGEKSGEPYLPVMPPYAESTLPMHKAKAIYQYLLTLNDEGKRGPAQVLVTAPSKKNQQIGPQDDPNEILISDRTRLFRTRVKGQSSRAVYVGTPSGLNYAFDPVSLSVERIWYGGFINLKGSLDGRGLKPSTLGYEAQEVLKNSPLLAPLSPHTSAPVDLSFKSPRMHDYERIKQTLEAEEDFSEQLSAADATFLGYTAGENPTFRYRVGKNEIHFTLTVSQDGQAEITLTGELKEPQLFRLSPLIKGQETDWKVSSLPAELTFSLPVKQGWRSQKPETEASQPVKYQPATGVKLPSGYSARRIMAPTDSHGRNQLFEPLGMVKSSDGSLLIATRTAGIWKLQNENWSLIAEGFQDCLGILEEKDGSLIISQKPELTRLTDEDGDGFYENHQTLSSAFLSSNNYHEYMHGPTKGQDGNYYIALNLSHTINKPGLYKANGKFMGSQGGYRGWTLQVTPEGKTSLYANGLRSPAGLATGPDGGLYYTENQGEYVGTSKLYRLEKDRFYGHPSGLVDLPGMNPKSPEIAWSEVSARKEKALALLPHSHVANSPGSPHWFPGDSTDHLWVGDQTLSTLFRIRLHKNHEAAVIPFADTFPSGVMRLLATDEKTLYVGQTGRGWRARGGSQDGLIIIQKEETSVNTLKNLTRDGDRFTLHFSAPLSETPALKDLKVTTWFYRDSPNYGSPEMSKTELKVTEMKNLPSENALQVTCEQVPTEKENRVFQIRSEKLPATKGGKLEAYYSIVRN